MITRIVFDANRVPTFVQVNTGKFMHNMSEYDRLKTMEFTEDEKRWFRKPLTR
jgi:hypothetical protein